MCDEIDIVEFIKTLPKHSELWVKMDIEGGEYNIINHLHKNDCLKFIDKLFIEWHYKKIPSITPKIHYDTLAMIRDVKAFKWDALDFSYISENVSLQYKIFLEDVINSRKLLVDKVC